MPAARSAPQAAAEEGASPPALPKGFGPSLSTEDDLTPAQDHHLRRLIARYNAKTPGSKRLTQEDRAHHADPRTAAGFDRRWKDLVYPLVIEKSKGAHLWDVDGNRYIDMLNGFGPNFFGHGAPFVKEALCEQLDSGFELGPQTPRAGEAARLLCELTGMDRASWVNTGSEAVQAAIRISRTVTSRDKIVVFEGSYHGNFDEVLVRRTGQGMGRTIPLAPGIPFESVGNVIVLRYGEDEALDLIAQHADEIAAVLVEPIQSRKPELQPKEFLHALRDLTREKDIVLVFDEVITGFRTGPGGAQAYFGVEADLATYGKVLGGGMPIGAVAGRAGVMDTFDGGFWQYGDESVPGAGVTFFAGTFVRHPLAIAAAYASLNYLKSAGPALQQGINSKAGRLETSLNQLFADKDVPFHMVRFGSQMFLRTGDLGPMASLFFYHLRDRGVHLLEGFPCYMTAAHTDEDVDFVLAAAEESLNEMLADQVIAGNPPAEFVRRYTPTPAQTEIWVAAQLDPSAHLAFNESDTFVFEGVDAAKLEAATSEVVSGIEAFRTTFDGDGSGARVHQEGLVTPKVLDHRGSEEAELLQKRQQVIATEAQQPFDLEAGPLARIVMIHETDDRVVLVIFAHHIIFDGWSAEMLLEDIAAAYRGDQRAILAPFSIYAAETGAKDDRAWWEEQWADDIPSLMAWPSAKADPAGDTSAATLSRPVSDELAAVLPEAVAKMGVSPSSLWLSAYGLALSELLGTEKLVIGVPAAGQALYGIEAMGCGVHLLPVQLHCRRDYSFSEFAQTVQRAVADAAEHPAVSLSALARTLNARTEFGRPPLVQAVFNYRAPFTGVSMADVTVTAMENPRHHLFQELFLNVTAHPSGAQFDAEYRTSLLSEPGVAALLDRMTDILDQAAATPEISLGAFGPGPQGDIIAQPAE
ncbi:MAG: aminotransferase class III-fold pyridoxal phosphate-dependent enzyme [Pseudomonadota bacterium]